MRRGRRLRFSLVVFAAAGGVCVQASAAQTAAPASEGASSSSSPSPAAPATQTPQRSPLPPGIPGIFAPKPARAAPLASAPSRRALSPEMAAKLGGVVNQAVAALPPPPPRPEGSDDPDVVRMDPFLVEDKEPPDFKERDLRRKKAFDDMAKRMGGSALGGPGIAAAASDAAMRERGREAKDLLDLTRIGGEAPPGMRKIVDEMNTRVNEKRAQKGTPFKEDQPMGPGRP